MSTPNNYAPPQSVVADIPSTDVPYEKATRLSRLGAVLLDILIFSVPLIPLYWVLFNTMMHAGVGHAGVNSRNFPALWLSAMLSAGVFMYLGLLIYLALLVVTIVLVYRNAQTIGKKLVGIKVARTDGSRASLARIFWLRNVVNQLVTMVLLFVPFVGGFYPLVDTCFIFGEQRRCVHDYIADTIVIRA